MEATLDRIVKLLEKLKRLEQNELIAKLTTAANANPTCLETLLHQIDHFESWYEGGLEAYLRNARHLLSGEENEDKWKEWAPSIPNNQNCSQLASLGSDLLEEMEEIGLKHVGECCFVVVAGGLGERLGYQGIKLSLPVETITNVSYLEAYVRHILALQHFAREKNYHANVQLPLAIMTSDDVHDKTLALLAEHNCFGMEKDQITLIKQEKVPCIDLDQNGNLNFVLCNVNDGSYRLMMKPHGHGDVHTLLFQSGLALKWKQQGKRYIHFLQDTNHLIVNSILTMIGYSVKNRWHMNSTAVLRKAKDASGALVQFTHKSKPEQKVIINIEYNELDSLLRSKFNPNGDVNEANGYSCFPGNINHLVLALDTYVTGLKCSNGFIPEFLNPKYSDESKTSFKVPARLECMMQDYPKLLLKLQDTRKFSNPPILGIGFALFEPWLVYSPCKNDYISASQKVKQDIPPQSAASAEHDLYAANAAKLRYFGAYVGKGPMKEWLGIPVQCGPHIVLSPEFGLSVEQMKKKFVRPSDVHISGRSTLVLEGEDIFIEHLTLDGALRIKATQGVKILVKCLVVKNHGYVYNDQAEFVEANSVHAMRGYVLEKKAQMDITINEPGFFVIDGQEIMRM